MAFSRKQFQDEFKELFFWEVGTVSLNPNSQMRKRSLNCQLQVFYGHD